MLELIMSDSLENILIASTSNAPLIKMYQFKVGILDVAVAVPSLEFFLSL
jgi:hypothetical protein